MAKRKAEKNPTTSAKKYTPKREFILRKRTIKVKDAEQNNELFKETTESGKDTESMRVEFSEQISQLTEAGEKVDTESVDAKEDLIDHKDATHIVDYNENEKIKRDNDEMDIFSDNTQEKIEQRDIFLDNYTVEELLNSLTEKTLTQLTSKIHKHKRSIERQDQHSYTSQQSQSSQLSQLSQDASQTEETPTSRTDKINFINNNAWRFGTNIFIERLFKSENLMKIIIEYLKKTENTKHYFDLKHASSTDAPSEESGKIDETIIQSVLANIKHLPQFWNLFTIDILDEMCHLLGFAERSRNKVDIIRALMEEVLLLGLHYTFNLLNAKTLKKDIYSRISDIPPRPSFMKTKSTTKKEILANIIGLCYPFFITTFYREFEDKINE